MKYTLTKTKQTRKYDIYDLPDSVKYNGKTYNMRHPCQLMISLNKDNKCLNDVFDIGTMPSKIHRRLLWVKTSEEFQKLWDDFIKQRNLIKKEEYKIRECAVCSKICERSKFMIGTCSDACRLAMIKKRTKVLETAHWCKSSSANMIKDKRSQTRKENDKLLGRVYTAWNKGKTGIYSPETIRKISNAALKQFSEKKFRKTNVEKEFENILLDLKINYIYSYIFHRRQFDFYLPESKTFVEIQGDFWHGNPKIYGTPAKPLSDHQKLKRLDDFVKKDMVLKENCYYIEFWEYDVYNNRNNIIEVMKGYVK